MFKKQIILPFIAMASMVLASCGPKIDVAKVADKNCICCVEDELVENRFIGAMKGVSNKAKTLRLQINKETKLLIFNEKTVLEGADSLATIKPQTCLIVDFKKEGEDLVAVKVKALPPLVERVKEYVVLTDYMEGKIKTVPPDTSSFLLVDSRPASVYNTGTIPGAINIEYPVLKQSKDIEKLLGKDKNKEIIFFCGGLHCNLAPGSAIVAKNAGYTNFKVYHLGFPAWRMTGHPVCLNVKGMLDQQKKNVSMIIIDMRENAAKDHIPGAINILQKDLPKWKAKFPDVKNPYNKNAPIVLYLDNNKCDKGDAKVDIAPALKDIFSWGYNNVAILNGGIERYKAAGGKTVANQLKTTISYTRNLLPGEIDVEDFVAKVKNPGAGDMIVDARPAEEFDIMHLPNAKNYPAMDINQSKVAEFANKTVYVYCNSGILAEIAYEKLNSLGVKNVKFVKTNVVYHDGFAELGTYKKHKIDLPKKRATEAEVAESAKGRKSISGSEGC